MEVTSGSASSLGSAFTGNVAVRLSIKPSIEVTCPPWVETKRVTTSKSEPLTMNEPNSAW